MEDFINILKTSLINEAKNCYKDNYDYYTHPVKKPLSKKLINIGKRLVYQKTIFKILFQSDFIFRSIFLKTYRLDKHIDAFDKFYNLLADDQSKKLFVNIICFRILGYIKVKLPLSTPEYWNGIKKIESLAIVGDFVELPSNPWKLDKHDLRSLEMPIQIYLNSKGIYTTFFVEQYKYFGDKFTIEAKEGDIAFDLGGCYGDTALYFAKKVGIKGKVFAFEFIPGNISVLNKNLENNKELRECVEVIDKPVWSESGLDVFYKDKGASSSVEFHDFEGRTGKTLTISIDDFVEQKKLNKVNFIKTDIEGAEPYAIKGAEKTLKRFRPKLAISIYHNMNDFTGIVKQIDDLGLGYKFYLGHSTIYTSETVLFCV